MKLTLLTHESDLTFFNSDFVLPILNKFFNVEYYDKTKKYDKSSTIVINGLFRDTSWAKDLLDFKVVVNNTAELRANSDSANKMYLTSAKYFWFSESLWYQWLGYDKFIPIRTYEKTALMPLRLARPARNDIFKAMTPFLDDFIYSYVAKGITLPDDLIENGDVVQRHFNPLWYNNTCFSMVSESCVSGQMFVTEKTFKTFAHLHPFMVYGVPGTLKFVQELGFETFDNLFDESYDTEIDNQRRLRLLVENVKNFKKVPYDKLTLDKLDYNKNLFFNKELVEQMVINEVINPIIEYAET